MTEAPSSKNLKTEVELFKRRHIRDAASHLFFRYGYETTTIDAIADRLHVSKPFIYNYYKNKGEILFDIAEVGISLSLERLGKCLATKDSRWDQLKLVVDQVTDIIIENQEHIVVYQREEKNLEQALGRKVREHRSKFDHRLAELLNDGHVNGEFDIEDPVLTANTIGGMMSWVAFWYQPGGGWSKAEIIAHLIHSVERLVSPRISSGDKATKGRSK